MDALLRIVGIAVICSVAVLVLRQSRPEYALFTQLAGLVCVFAVGTQILSAVLGAVQSMLPDTIADGGYLTLLCKTLAVAALGKLGGSLCADAGSSALQFAVELTARAVILLLCMPMLRALAEVAVGLLKG